MLGTREMGEAVKILDAISDRFTVYNSATGRNESFSKFCRNFCTINEPNGLLVRSNFGNTSDHIDLSYPITTVLGRQLHMDPHFFGAKVAIPLRNLSGGSPDDELVVSVNQLQATNGHFIFDTDAGQLPNNIREVKLVGLQFRAERPESISQKSIEHWERSIVHYIRREFKSDYVDALVLAESFITSEVVRAGLSLIPFLLIGFCIMVTFSSVTMGLSAIYVGQMGPHKFLLAFMACVCPFMATGTALGMMFWIGFRFGSILCVTGFLVLAIGVDDAYLMINSWQRVRERREKQKKLATAKSDSGMSIDYVSTTYSSPNETSEQMMREVMRDTGASITITTLTNILAFTIGALTPTPEIRLFCIGNGIALTVDYVYQWTVFGALMAVVGKRELRESSAPSRASSVISYAEPGSCSHTFMDGYCRLLTNGFVASLVMGCFAVYVYLSVYGLLTMKAELRPEQLFLRSSDILKIMELRNEYIIPYYAVCIVFVNNPGNLTDPMQIKRLHNLVHDFETMPSSLGRFSTKFWLRDYEEFIASSEETNRLLAEDADAFEATLKQRGRNELKQFLEWPEFDFWNGFVRIAEPSPTSGGQVQVEKFFFTTAYYGAELRDWSNRAELLNRWRHVADSYPSLQVSIYEDDSKFLDLIPTMVPQTMQSSICTLLCMFVVCLLFITHPTTVIVANFSIFSTCIGVFGLLSLQGIDLDPLVMSAGIMSIGFAVDIPAHLCFHYYRAGIGEKAIDSVEERLRHCIGAIGFPVLEAGFSTIICVLSLTFVDLHMAQVFAKTMVLVVALGLVHGLIIIPVLFFFISLVPAVPRPQSPKTAPLDSGAMDGGTKLP
ncbi:Protein PTR-14 [Aphelenchoides avenae]|nr:Protein PTR-14 [Aphelenchus avenae]